MPPVRADEAERLAILADHDFDLLRGEVALRRLTDFAAALCEAPTALVSLVTEQTQEFVARTGLDAPSTPRRLSFCAHAVASDSVLIVPDAARDPRFAANELVTGEMHIRFYAGVPLHSREGLPLGTLCVIAPQPRPGLTPLQRQGLEVIAEQVARALETNRSALGQIRADVAASRALSESDRRFRGLADAVPQMVWSTRPDGYPDYFNRRWYEFTGVDMGATDGDAWSLVLHPDDRERSVATWQAAVESGEPYEIEYRLRRADGSYRWALGNGLPQRDEDGQIIRWFGTCTDIHEQRMALEEREIISQELSHRIKNIFAVVIGLIGVAARERPELGGAADELRERIGALGRAHDYVRPHSARSLPTDHAGSLHGLFRALFAPYETVDQPRFAIGGDDVTIDDRSATPLALFFHEIATNAIKYGALSTDTGRVAITVASVEDLVRIDWRETGGPPVKAPAKMEGFGSRLVELSIVRQLGGSVDRDWAADGLRISAVIPLSAMRR